MTPAQDLVWKLIDQSITPQEFEELELLLLEDAELRQYYQDCLETHGVFGQIATTREKKTKKGSAFKAKVSRPGYAAAIGAVAGILSTSAVVAFVVPKAAEVMSEIVPVVGGAFEDPNQVFKDGFSKNANEWFFQAKHSVEAAREIIALEGEHLLRLQAKENRKLGMAYYMVDLNDFPEVRDADHRGIRVKSGFHADLPGHGDRYGIRIAAFSEPPSEIGPIWADESQLFAHTLQRISRGAFTKAGDSGWMNLSTEMDIPHGTRTIIVGLTVGHGRNPDEDRSHFIDGISVSFLLDSPRF